MMQYLVYQRQQVQQYAALAAPVVSFLEGRVPAGGKEPGRSLAKWQRIIADLQKFQSKVPGTSVAALEDFISTQIDRATPENCQAGFLVNAAARGGDYFVQTREQIRNSLYNQCRLLAGQNAVQAFTQISKFFNQHLAGKFPFAPRPQEQLPAEADPQDVAELFKLLDSSGKTIHAGLQNGTFGNSYSKVLTFLNQLEALRPLFSPMLAADADPIPMLDFIPVFRVNQGREINGNQIIDWTLQVGNDTFRYRDPQRVGRWDYGQPVKLILRWAKDSPQQPASANGALDGKLSGRTVVFEYRDTWSLFTLLALHQPLPGDFDRLADPEPQTLVFNVNDGKSSSPVPQSGDSSQAKVFIRLKLRPPGKPDNVRLRAFPTEAPLVEPEKTQAQSGGAGGDNQ
jgi:type VI secretion system protein ImpL